MRITDTYKTKDYIRIRVEYSDIWGQRSAEAKAIEKWCIDCQCGKRVNPWSYAFKNEAELTMFRLRWCK
jgi:hypothetical protein